MAWGGKKCMAYLTLPCLRLIWPNSSRERVGLISCTLSLLGRWVQSAQQWPALNMAPWGKADPLLHKVLGATESVILVPWHSFTLEHPGRLQLQRTLLQQLLLQQATAPGWLVLSRGWGVGCRAIFVSPLAFTQVQLDTTSPISPEQSVHSTAHAKHRVLTGKEMRFLTSFFSS